MIRPYRVLTLAAASLAAASLLAQPPEQSAPPAGRGAQGAGAGRGGPGGGGGRGGGRRGGFTQFTRPAASQDVLARGKALYETNCGSCHSADLRGSATGVSLLRSLPSLNDQHGETVGAEVAK